MVSAFFMFYAAKHESAIVDEMAHIPAGYGYMRFQDFRLNPEHPPLVKALAAIPLLFMDLNFPTDKPVWQTEVNGQWGAGNEFIYKYNPEKYQDIEFLSRIFPIILTLVLMVLVFWVSRRLMGDWWALVPTFFVAFSPHILAHGHYVTTDIGAALGFFMGLYSFARFLMAPTRKRFFVAGVLFGIAQLMKFSVVLLIPLFGIMILAFWWMRATENGGRFFSKRSCVILARSVAATAGVMLVGVIVIWAVYFVFTINYPIEKQVSDTAFILNSFAGGPQSVAQACVQSPSLRCLAEIDLRMASQPVFRSLGQYLLGVLMVMQRSSGGNTAYFLGEVGASGWWYYFPVVYFLKESLPALMLAFGGLFFALWRLIRNPERHSLTKRLRNYLHLNFVEFSMLVFVIFYWIYSMKSPLNIGFRHILPTIPFIYILAVVSLRRFSHDRRLIPHTTILKKAVIPVLMVWMAAETALGFPYFISYFNEIGKGTRGGWQYVVDSNYDWGQDLARLKTFVEENNIDKIAVDYFGGADVRAYLGDRAVQWSSSYGDPRVVGITWLASSIGFLQDSKAPTVPGYYRDSRNEYSWLANYEKPDARAGTSIFIYNLGKTQPMIYEGTEKPNN